jgi:mono/diheme cytochrome c family protein
VNSDPEAVERGAYLVHAVAHCSFCHTSEGAELLEQPPLSGGRVIATPLAESRSSNLTADAETGIRAQSDMELARAIRHAVRADGSLSTLMKIGVGPMADSDLADVIAYLRSQAPVRHEVRESQIRLAGEALLALGLMGPNDRTAPPFVPPMDEPSVARGRYLAEGPANCIGCHTRTNPLADFVFAAPAFSGGIAIASEADRSVKFTPPNLTPEPGTGAIASWSEERFVARLRAGPVHHGSPMPWANYMQMREVDLRSLYRFLRSLEPVVNAPGPARRGGDTKRSFKIGGDFSGKQGPSLH